ncbi:AIG2-like [Macleaya cordata]|uniref:Putative gamma-glutamylcyclotransferase n=1 Tax=Macleaya cordata TaxID=56857 RepID=A0A200R9A4_MACCD|nr:AIG2-like [Macleaya cordata]
MVDCCPRRKGLHGRIKRFSIKGRVYPAILPVENTKVNGKVLLGITDPELDILDSFEDDEYERSTVNISLIATYEKIQAHTYVWVNKTDPNLYGDWNFEEWRQLHMNDFLKMTAGFMEELEGPESKPRVATYESFFKEGAEEEKKPPLP